MQAARGTAVTHDDGDRPEGRPPLIADRRTWLTFAVVAAFSYAVDQVTKHLAVQHLTGRPDVSVVGELLQLRLTRNPGAAFSIGTDFTMAISVLAIAATVVVLWFSRRLADPIWAVAFGLMFAGIVGNLTDRLLRAPGPLQGEVVDFLMLPNWPIFNVADICLTVAVPIVLLQALRGIGLDGRPERPAADEEE
jgi:signal peptidase II